MSEVMVDNPKLILASSSLRRVDLLAQIGVTADAIQPTDIDETPLKQELPRDLAKRLALAKGAKAAAATTDAMVLSADTVVACGRRALPKAEDVDQAAFCIDLLSGRSHRVFSAVALTLLDGRVLHRVVMTAVTFKRLDSRELSLIHI